jgi:protein phosphatase
MRIEIPRLSLVVLVGATSSGKSTFARAHFRPTEIVSSDAMRAVVSDDENDQRATQAAFEVLHLIVAKRLERGRLTVVDATNVLPRARAPLLALARRYHLPAVAVVLDLPEDVAERRRAGRTDRDAGPDVLARQREQLHRALDGIAGEGFAAVWVLRAPEEVAAAEVARVPLPCDRTWDRGPFDIVGDVHGCGEELAELLDRLGYAVGDDGVARHPAGRRLVFVGDLVDRGPRVVEVLRLAMDTAAAGLALCVPGNHDDKLLRRLRGRAVHVTHGLERTLEQLAGEPPEFVARVADYVEALPSHLVLDGGRLVVAHAGMRRDLQGRESRRVRDFALFGETTGELDAHGLPVRLDWAASYHGAALVVYGHTPVAEPRWRHETVDVDTGCVFGGRLTALRYPEREIVSVPSRAQYAVPARPFLPQRPGGAPASPAPAQSAP